MTRRGAVLMMLGACSATPDASPHRSSPPPAASSDAPHAGDPAMMHLIHELVALLSKDIAFDDITGRLGPVAHDPGAPMPAELTSREVLVRHVEVGRYPDTGKPYTVDLELTAPLPVASLVATFGAYRQNRTDRGTPREIVFPPAGDGPWHVVVIARLPPGASPIADDATSSLTLRRDPR